ncbi:MAG: GNAT family N-acetyltransferase [Verrucomicrobia bacterium]|nr:GNAT family N-acetyltransferase [Verrucomicrobiota bacterium]
MSYSVCRANPAELLPLRVRQREELNCQIVHDSIPRREGWTEGFRLTRDGTTVGFGSVAVAGPWKDRPTVFEFYLLPECRWRAFALFEAFLAASGARWFEVQSNDALLTSLAVAQARDLASEKIVFKDGWTTHDTIQGAVLRRQTPVEEIQSAIERQQGGGEWVLELDGVAVGRGGVLFHYNRPYGDVYMEVDEPFRQRGLGAFLVQELKRECYVLGAIPAARCSPDNLASRRTLQRAGFVPCAHILIGALADR